MKHTILANTQLSNSEKMALWHLLKQRHQIPMDPMMQCELDVVTIKVHAELMGVSPGLRTKP